VLGLVAELERVRVVRNQQEEGDELIPAVESVCVCGRV